MSLRFSTNFLNAHYKHTRCINAFLVIRRDVDVVDDQTQWQRAIEEEVQEER